VAIAIRSVESASHTARDLHTLTELNDITRLTSALTSPCSAVYPTLPGDNNHDEGDRQPARARPSARAVSRERLHVSTVSNALPMHNLLERQRVRSMAAVAPKSARVEIPAVNARATAATAHAPLGTISECYDEFYLQGAWFRTSKLHSV
jgi:hypothetical protein